MKQYNPDIHKRRSIRLKGYDYSSNGLYFITICVQNKQNLFGSIQDGIMNMNAGGKTIEKYWLELGNKYENTKLHDYVIMPNHIHGIIEISNHDTTTVGVPLVGTRISDIHVDVHRDEKQGKHKALPLRENLILGDIIGGFKSLSTNAYINQVILGISEPFDKKLWQRNYHEHIIRDENGFNKIVEYIRNNPSKWNEDNLHPE